MIRPTLAYVGEGLGPGFCSQSAVELLLGTAAHESHFEYLAQISGPARGIYQIEPATCDDVLDRYLAVTSRQPIRSRILDLTSSHLSRDHQLVTDLGFSTAVARIVYWKSDMPLAAAGDIDGHARVWKRVYNTALGKGRESDFVSNYRRYVAPYI